MNDAKPNPSQVFDIEDLRNDRRTRGGDYLSFLEVPALSLGLYELKKGATDPQSPHTFPRSGTAVAHLLLATH